MHTYVYICDCTCVCMQAAEQPSQKSPHISQRSQCKIGKKQNKQTKNQQPTCRKPTTKTPWILE